MTSPIDSVGPPATLPANYDPTTAKLNASGTGKPPEMFDSEMFLNLLVAQLKYQDPTSPVDTSNFMNQTAMLSQVQTMNTMSDTLADMMTAQQTASATSMIGKAISFVDPSGKQVSGVVDGVSFVSGSPMLHVGDLAVPLGAVLVVADPVPVDSTGGTAGSTDDLGAVDGVTDGTVDGTTGGTGAPDATGSTDAPDGTQAADDVPGAAENDAAAGDSTADPAIPATPDSTDPDSIAVTTRPDTISA